MYLKSKPDGSFELWAWGRLQARVVDATMARRCWPNAYAQFVMAEVTGAR